VTARATKQGVRPLSPVVVKLGGSLAESGRLASIMQIVGGARRPCVVVPGGGVFADAVREAQKRIGFSDAAAHRMALLAMHQTAYMLQALEPRLRFAETLAGIRRTLAERQMPVWLPLRLAENDPFIPTDWSITSDGLAARLAERLGRAHVVLVKACRVARSSSLAALGRAGIVDPTFVAVVERSCLDWSVLGAGDERELAGLLRLKPKPGRASRSAGRRAPSVRAIARK
jgi:aspartokinase-like uncharacterized kinase